MPTALTDAFDRLFFNETRENDLLNESESFRTVEVRV